jgi:hypothetical protein
MRDRGIRFELVSYVPKRFKHWPPYYGILEMCLTNATLPSKSLGGSEVQPQIQEGAAGQIPVDLATSGRRLERGQRVVRLIGYDAGPRDTARANHALSIDDPLYDYQYPLREWRWDRPTASPASRPRVCRCPKSACWLCIANHPDEIRGLRNGACGSSCWSRHAQPRGCTRSRACGADRPARAPDR